MGAAFTPGPWSTNDPTPEHFSRDRATVFVYGNHGGNHPRIACVQFGLSLGHDVEAETRANARLISAAPNLYEALRDLLTTLDAATNPDDFYYERKKAREALCLVAQF